MDSDAAKLVEISQEDTGEECACHVSVRGHDAWEPIDVIHYRGYDVEMYEDPYGSQVWCRWKNQIVEFGSDNTMYGDDVKRLIDDEIDTIVRFDEYPGAKVTWFDNGDHRDIKLVEWGRILKVYLIDDPTHVDAVALMQEAQILLNYIHAKEKRLQNSSGAL